MKPSCLAARRNNACGRLELHIFARRIKNTVERGNRCAVGRGVVHGRAEYVSVGSFALFGNVGNAVVAEYAPVFAAFFAAAATYAAAHGAVP